MTEENKIETKVITDRRRSFSPMNKQRRPFTRSAHPSRGPQRPSFGNKPAGQRGPWKRNDARGGHRQNRGRRGEQNQTINNLGDSARSLSVSPLPPIGENLWVIPLGGVEEIGRNMTAVQYKDEIVVIDAGIQFTTDDTPGVDYILPNIHYLIENKHKVKALVITHGHLDHIGGIPYIMDKIGNPPLYTREFGALLIKKRQSEFPHLPELDIKIVDKNDKAPTRISDNFKVSFFGLTHSIPDSTGVILQTPMGDIVNTGDVRVDNHDGIPDQKEIEHYKIFKDREILLLTVDSTGIDKQGWCMAEDIMFKNIDRIVSTAPGRTLIATFSSQIERIIEFMKMAKKYGKKVAIEGRSMKNNVDIIKFLNLVETDHVIQVEDIDKYPANKILMLATGSQGEEFSALVRMSNQTHKFVKLQKTDTIILSSSVIPGNDRAVEKLKDSLFRHDCKIITYQDSDVHTSGHGKRGELEWIHQQINYKYFMPVHGSHFRLKMHAEMAKDLGKVQPENIIVPENGNIIEITPSGASIKVLKEKVRTDDIVVEGHAVGNIQEVVLRDRLMLAQDGIFIVFGIINPHTGKLRKSPDIISRGFIYLRESQELLYEARSIVKTTVEDCTKGMGNMINLDEVKEKLSDNVAKFLFQKTAKRPIIIPVILSM